MPEISVIVPIYQSEKYLRTCVDSLLAQTFTDVEFILVDDGSPDNSGAICDEYARQDSRVRVIHQKNGGPSAARNSGMRAARGNYIMFCDGDDSVHAKWCEQLHEAMLAHPDKFVNCDLTKVEESSAGGGAPFR